MKCNYCRREYRGQSGATVKVNGKIVRHFCSEQCLQAFYYVAEVHQKLKEPILHAQEPLLKFYDHPSKVIPK